MNKEEMQELKKKYENAVADYETAMFEKEQLKKQLEERTKMYQNAYHYSQKMEDKTIILETQQKEFIKFLKDNYKETQDIWYIKILQKYKEIIGDINDKK